MNYKKYMKKCIKLALKADGKTSPNPLVGCIVLDKNGEEISNGYHEFYGQPHAEANALNKLKNNEAIDGTIIVNLEPCSHWGKNPPCADLIIKKGIKRLVTGMKDPNSLVTGEGIEKCKKAGIEVIENLLYDECIALNEVFIKNHTKNEAFIAIKIATTLDGKIATKTGSSKWITSEKARKEVQKIRNRYDAILTTSSTVIQDNPSMTCRLKNCKNPIKIILDRELKTNLNSKIYNLGDEKIYLVINETINKKKLENIPNNINIIQCPSVDSKLDLTLLFKELYKLNIMSILVEAGGKLNGELVSLNLVDKIYHFIAPKILGDKNGISSFEGRSITEINDSLKFKVKSVVELNPDILITYSSL